MSRRPLGCQLMCGIAGWLDPGTNRSNVELQAMAEAIKHRGPDDRDQVIDHTRGLALVHNRLSIIDLSAAGRQPMPNEDGTVLLIFNGEIYNFVELRTRLVAAGHVFRSRTDSEVIIHGYEEWGITILAKLKGMFAFALWDGRKGELVLARDPMGIKPLYYWTSETGGIVFASEIKAFLALDSFHAEIDSRSLRQYMEFNFIPDPERSSLKGVKKLPAGHFLVVGPGQAGRKLYAPRCYFSAPKVEGSRIGSGEDRVERLHGVLSQVVKEHMVADVPVGLLLSGGLDSSLVAAFAAKHGPVRTITMGFADSEIDERPHARLVSQFIGSQHEEVLISSADVVSGVEEAIWYADDLFGDWGLISTMPLYRKCREAGVKVVLVGEGSDELFGGYGNFLAADRAQQNGGSFLRIALRLYQGYSGRRWGRELGPFIETFRSLRNEVEGDTFSAVRLFETRYQLPNNYNMKVDKASMAASVEARVPFLDVRVAEEAYRTPREFLLRGGSDKDLLRRVAERYALLPAETIRRPKFGAGIASSWMDRVPGFRSFAREVVLDSSGLTRQLGLQRAMENYFDRSIAGYKFPHALSIFPIIAWRLLLLNLWSRHYLVRRDRRAAA
ncbi:MAG: asparagine synthase (glutamine-hydrolyzing) [Thermoanaerobaculia bacterium]